MFQPLHKTELQILTPHILHDTTFAYINELLRMIHTRLSQMDQGTTLPQDILDAVYTPMSERYELTLIGRLNMNEFMKDLAADIIESANTHMYEHVSIMLPWNVTEGLL